MVRCPTTVQKFDTSSFSRTSYSLPVWLWSVRVKQCPPIRPASQYCNCIKIRPASIFNKKRGESYSYQLRKVLCVPILHNMSQMYRTDSFTFSIHTNILCRHLWPRHFPVTFSLFSIKNAVKKGKNWQSLIRAGIYNLHSPKNWLLLIIQIKIGQK